MKFKDLETGSFFRLSSTNYLMIKTYNRPKDNSIELSLMPGALVSVWAEEEVVKLNVIIQEAKND